MSSTLALALLAARPSGVERLIRNIMNNPFAGIHQLDWFDWALLIPYFTVLFILSIYGIHRYDVIHTYFKHRKKAQGEPARRFDVKPSDVEDAVAPARHFDPLAAIARAAGRCDHQLDHGEITRGEGRRAPAQVMLGRLRPRAGAPKAPSLHVFVAGR